MRKLEINKTISHLSKNECQAIITATESALDAEQERQDKLVYFIIGIVLGTLGSYLMNVFQEIVKSINNSAYVILTSIILAIFLILSAHLYLNLRNQNENMESSRWTLELIKRAKSLEQGPKLLVK